VGDNSNLLKGIYWGCIAVALIGLLAYCKLISFTDAIFNSDGLPRLQSTLQYANTTALLMAVGYFISCYLIEKSLKQSQRILNAIFGNILLIALALTFSRMAILFFLALYLVLLFFFNNRQKLFTIIQITLCFGVALLTAKMIGTVNAIGIFILMTLLITGITYALVSLEKLGEKTTDAAILFNIADNLTPEDSSKFLAQVHRILKPEGRLLMKLNPYITEEKIKEWNI
jgi:hypothetical protein